MKNHVELKGGDFFLCIMFPKERKRYVGISYLWRKYDEILFSLAF
jgi:hypothetical protein